MTVGLLEDFCFLVMTGLTHAAAFSESAGITGPPFPQGLCSSRRLNHASSPARGSVPGESQCDVSDKPLFVSHLLVSRPIHQISQLTKPSQCGRE